MYISHAGVYRTPKPLTLDAAPDLFSEARTLRHVELLTADPAGRLVGHPAMEKGITYVLGAAREVEALAADREDITVHVSPLAALSHALSTAPPQHTVLRSSLYRISTPDTRSIRTFPSKLFELRPVSL